jgi:hypothetical protein
LQTTELVEQEKLLPDELKLYDDDHAMFLRTFGDSYVAGLTTGGVVYGAFVLERHRRINPPVFIETGRKDRQFIAMCSPDKLLVALNVKYPEYSNLHGCCCCCSASS